MKKLVLCLSALAVLACKEEPKVDYAVLSGKLEKTKAKKAVLEGFNYNQDITIDAEGNFADTLKIAENGFYTLTIGRERANMYVKTGDNFTIGKDSLGGFTFTGSGATESNYLASKRSNTRKLRGASQAFYSLDEAAYKAKVNEIKESNKTALEKIEGIDKAFLAAELKNLEYDSYALLNDYGNAHAYFTKKDSFKPSDDFLPKALKELTYDDANAFKTSKSYQQLAFGNVMNPIFEGLDDFNSIKPSDLSAITAVKIPELKNQIVEYLGKMALSPANSNLSDMYAFLRDNTTDEKIKEDLKINFDKVKDLTKGNPSPTFVNYENHKGGTTSLADLKGKYVYVDVWATWCGPCKAEIPSLKKVEKEYHGKNIAFVSTSVDVANAHQKWVDMVNKEELGGIQLIADKDWKSQFVVDYGINGIPRFILIDPVGNIVSADAPRPSDPKLKELFDSLDI